MIPSAHVGSDALAAYAAGSLSDGMSLLVASHLTFCPACRAKVARLEAVGGALLAATEAPQPVAGGPEAVLARLDRPAANEIAPATSEPALPRPIIARLGGEPRWRFLLPGLAECRLDGFDDEAVSLMRVRPGVRIPAHTHTGDEATLVLSGQMRDRARTHRRGDVALADARDDHRPEIVGDEVCICLAVLTGTMRSTGPFGRALNLLGR